MPAKLIKTEDYVREVVTIFFAQKRLITTTFLLFVAVTMAVAFFWPPTYAVEGSILVKGRKLEKSPEALEDTELKMLELDEKDIASEMQIIGSHDVIGKTVAALRDKGAAFENVELTEDRLKRVIAQIQGRLSTKVKADSNVIVVSLADKDPGHALTVLNELMHQYLNHRSSVFNPGQTVQFYEDQLAKFDESLKTKEKEQIELARIYSSPNPAQEIDNNLLLKKQLEQQLDDVRTRWIEKEMYVEHLQQALESQELQFFSSIQNQSIALLGEKLQNLVIERGNVLRVYHPESEVVQAMNEQVASTYASLKSEVAAYAETQLNEADILGDQISTLENRLRELSARNIELHTYLIEKQRIQREIDLLQHSFDIFFKRLEEARINTGTLAGSLFSISILSKPFFSGEAVFPRKRTFIPVGLFVGFLTACSLGFLVEYFDHTFKRPEDSAKFVGVPAIFSVPRFEG